MSLTYENEQAMQYPINNTPLVFTTKSEYLFAKNNYIICLSQERPLCSKHEAVVETFVLKICLAWGDKSASGSFRVKLSAAILAGQGGGVKLLAVHTLWEYTLCLSLIIIYVGKGRILGLME